MNTLRLLLILGAVSIMVFTGYKIYTFMEKVQIKIDTMNQDPFSDEDY